MNHKTLLTMFSFLFFFSFFFSFNSHLHQKIDLIFWADDKELSLGVDVIEQLHVVTKSVAIDEP